MATVPIPTPQTLQEFARQLNADVGALNTFLLQKSTDIAQNPGAYPLADWSGFFGRWTAWFAIHESMNGSSGYMGVGPVEIAGGPLIIAATLQSRRASLEGFAAAAKSRWNGDAPAIGPWPEIPVPSLENVEKTAKRGVAIVILGIGLWAAVQIFGGRR